VEHPAFAIKDCSNRLSHGHKTSMSTKEDTGVQRLAAAHLFGLARNHPFVDGNKRVAYATAEVFLLLNGFAVTAQQVEKYEMVMRLASGDLSEEGAARWFAEHTAPADAPSSVGNLRRQIA
jgi:death-on-curing family protein